MIALFINNYLGDNFQQNVDLFIIILFMTLWFDVFHLSQPLAHAENLKSVLLVLLILFIHNVPLYQQRTIIILLFLHEFIRKLKNFLFKRTMFAILFGVKEPLLL